MAEDVLPILQAFVLNNPDFERLEALLDDFNPFVAMGWTRQEIRHSLFLRWLLDPRETHGQGAYFLRQFLKTVAAQAPSPTADRPTVVDLDSWPYTATTVLTEWKNIDLFIRDDTEPFVCVIENKIDGGEHGAQLRTYRDLIQGLFPTYKKMFIYLTVEGTPASDEGYLPFSHAQVASLVQDVLKRRKDQLSPEVSTFLAAYVEMVRRNIVEDSEIQRLCERIYRTHHKALEVLFEHRPDRASEIKDFLVELIEAHPDLVKDHCTKGYVRFVPKAWDDAVPHLGKDWTPSNRMVLCELDQTTGSVHLKVILGPGEASLRERLVARIREQGTTLNRSGSRTYPQWWTFHAEDWVSRQHYEEDDLEKVKNGLRESLGSFLTRFEKVKALFAASAR